MNVLGRITGPPLIRALKDDLKITNAKIADRCVPKVTPIYVSNVINGQRKGYRVRKVIASMLQVPEEALWPPEDEEEPELPAAA